MYGSVGCCAGDVRVAGAVGGASCCAGQTEIGVRVVNGSPGLVSTIAGLLRSESLGCLFGNVHRLTESVTGIKFK